MKTTRNACLSLFLLLVLPLSAADLERRISVDLEDAAAADVLTSFGHVLELEVEIADGVDGKVSIRLDEVSVRTVMTAVCESLGCAWDLAGTGDDRRLRFAPAEPALRVQAKEVAALSQSIDMSLVDAPAETILASFASILESKLETECEGAQELVSIELKAVELRFAIDLVCSKIGCVCVVEPGVVTVRGR